MKLLDLFCGAGGAAMGYSQAGFTEIVGIDIVPQPNYPFNFIQADALKLPVRIDDFDLIHASPPCQRYTSMNHRGTKKYTHPDLLKPTQDMLEEATYASWVIENVRGARSLMSDAIELTGEMFDLKVHRPRLFLTSFNLLQPSKPSRQHLPTAIYGPANGRLINRNKDGSELRAWSSLDEGREAMEVWWMKTETEIRESIPPRYTKFIGEAFLQAVVALG